MKKALLITVLCLSFNGLSQFVNFAIEPILGLNYFRFNPSEKIFLDRGVVYHFGMKAQLTLGNRFAVAASAGHKFQDFHSGNFVNSTLTVNVINNYKYGWRLYVEGGLEVSELAGVSIPLFFGYKNFLSKNTAFNLRLRLPTFLDAAFIQGNDAKEAGVEVGLQFFLMHRKTELVTRSGNPFILK